MAKPTKLPEWASKLGVDPVTKQNNRVEPDEAVKDSGFTFNEKPSRQTFNWLLYTIYEWIKWLNENIDQELNTDSDVTFHNIFATLLTCPTIHAGNVNSSNVEATTEDNDGEMTADIITANVSITTPEIIITENEGRSKRINEGVFGNKYVSSNVVPTNMTIITFNGVCDSLNLESSPSDNTKFKIKYPGKYKITMNGYSEVQTLGTSIAQYISVYKNGVDFKELNRIKIATASVPDKFPICGTVISSFIANDELTFYSGSGGSNGGFFTGIFTIEMIGD